MLRRLDIGFGPGVGSDFGDGLGSASPALLRSPCDGTTNLIGALRRAMATTGYTEVKELQRIEVVVAPHQPS